MTLPPWCLMDGAKYAKRNHIFKNLLLYFQKWGLKKTKFMTMISKKFCEIQGLLTKCLDPRAWPIWQYCIYKFNIRKSFQLPYIFEKT